MTVFVTFLEQIFFTKKLEQNMQQKYWQAYARTGWKRGIILKKRNNLWACFSVRIEIVQL